MTRREFVISSAAAVGMTMAFLYAAQPVAQTRSSVWDGVYSAAQAQRGKGVYAGQCGRCHGEDLANPNIPLVGERFAEHWETHSLGDLFRRIRDTMPPQAVATVEEPAKLDAIAYVLQQNGFPEGAADLRADAAALDAIDIIGQAGPAPPRTGTLVRTVGCLVLRDEREWQLTSATEPQRATLDARSAGGRPTATAHETGARTIVLLNPFPSPSAHRGHRVAATGFLVRNADGDAVNVVSLEMLAPSCGS